MSSYDSGRARLALVLTDLHQQGMRLEPHTYGWVVRLDHDGLMSERMGVDVTWLLEPHTGPDCSWEQMTQHRWSMGASSIDYSREVHAEPRAIAGPFGPDEQANASRILSHETHLRREPDEFTKGVKESGAVPASEVITPPVQCERTDLHARDEGPSLG